MNERQVYSDGRLLDKAWARMPPYLRSDWTEGEPFAPLRSFSFRNVSNGMEL